MVLQHHMMELHNHCVFLQHTILGLHNHVLYRCEMERLLKTSKGLMGTIRRTVRGNSGLIQQSVS